jgi:branched-chain amino acid transport system ATP-binding protein
MLGEAPPLLRLAELQAFYGESRVLNGVDLRVLPGEVVTLLGRNGAGKTTTLKSIMGIVPSRAGTIELNGLNLIDFLPEQIARLGIAFCPEDRGIFASLTVVENLLCRRSCKPAA